MPPQEVAAWGVLAGNGGTCVSKCPVGQGEVGILQGRWGEEDSGGRYEHLFASLRWHIPAGIWNVLSKSQELESSLNTSKSVSSLCNLESKSTCEAPKRGES